ncbi:MAG: alpha/beta hydrolase, partial [Eubacteriales bacterium]|nr:alpha/beta hydrolase [Eubacteriales bacterium]
DGEAKKNAEMLGLMVNWPKIRTQELSALTMPTLVIAGTDDMIKKTHTRIIAENIPGAKLVFLEGDHFIAYKVPEEFNRVVGDFLSGRDFSDE